VSANTLSGREAARLYRQRQLVGRSPSSQKSEAKTRPAASATAMPTPTAKAPKRASVTPVAANVAAAGGRAAARRIRELQKKMGGAAMSQKGQGAGDASKAIHPKLKAKMKKGGPVIEPRQKNEAERSAVKRPSAERKLGVNTAPVVQMTGRSVAKAFRMAGAQGKAAQDSFRAKGTQSGAVARIVDPNASVRDIAKKIRTERCTKGKRGCSLPDSVGNRRRRSKPSSSRPGVPQKVEESETLSGQTVTGTQVGQGRKTVTGFEQGSCQLVSGTEYLGAEEFEKNCDMVPQPNASKVSVTKTTRGQLVTGVEVGLSESVTGDEPGQCAKVTGTEYIPADQSELFCGGVNNGRVNNTRSVSTMSTPSREQSVKVTGGDGSSEPTATQVNNVIKRHAPEKVVTSKTLMGAVTTGTQVGRQVKVTGAEEGECKRITGTGYKSYEEIVACGTEPEAPPAKVVSSVTVSGQKITGDRSGAAIDITGAEAGACQPVTGTEYVGLEQVSVCPAEKQEEIVKRVRDDEIEPPISGIQPGPQGLTGAQRGACKQVSGTPYQGPEQTAMVCDVANAAIPGQSDFPIMMGVNTPSAGTVPTTMPNFIEKTNDVEHEVSKGVVITGDGWDRGGKVTGTEGPWAATRNASIRGVRSQMPMGAAHYRPVTMDAVPPSPITGSAGNTTGGAKVTLSGGARA